MAAKIISIEIGQRIIRICEVEYKKKHPKVYQCISFETPENTIEDGLIYDVEGLASVIKAHIEKAGIKQNKVVFTIASTKIANREVVIPNVKENRIRDIIIANANEYFPINIDEYTISHVVLEKVEKDELKQLRLLVLAAPEAMIKKYYELADRMKMTVAAIDYFGNSSYQSFKAEEYPGVNLMVQMSDESTMIHLMEQGTLLLQRTLPYGTDMLTQTVIESEAFQVTTFADALRLVCEKPILNSQFGDGVATYASYNGGVEEDGTSAQEQAREEVTNSLRLLVSNINRVIDYFGTKEQGKKIEQIQLIGDGRDIQNLDVLIANEIGISTVKAEQFNHIAFVNQALAEGMQNHYGACIGAAIAPVGFAPKELALKTADADSMRFPLMMLGVCGVGAIFIFLSSIIMYRHARYERNELQEKIASIADIEQIYNDYQDSKRTLGILEEINGMTSSPSEQMTELLGEIEQKTPKGCVIQSMQLVEKTFTIQVKANNKTLCAKYIQMLKTIDKFSGVTTTGYSQVDSKQKDGPVSFTAVCTFK